MILYLQKKWQQHQNIFLATAALLLAAIYFLNAFAPLRLNNDTLRYFAIKEWLEAGGPTHSPAEKEFLPHGYPWFLVLLSSIHICRAFFISFFQLLFLLGSAWFIQKIFSPSIKFLPLLILLLTGWASLKFVITPLSEMQFLFFSTGALYFFKKAEEEKRMKILIPALLFSAIAIFTRTIGFVIILSVAGAFTWRNLRSTGGARRTGRLISFSALVILLVVLLFYKQIGVRAYLDEHTWFFRNLFQHPLDFIFGNVKQHLVDWAGLFLNIPEPKLNLPADWVGARQLLFLLAGLFSFLWLMYALFKKGSAVPLLIKIYLIFYSFFIINWPLFEPRLWMPIWPLALAVFLMEIKGRGKINWGPMCWLSVYLCIGCMALGYYTYTGFNRKSFAVKQDAGIWRNEYETYFFGKPLSDTAKTTRLPVVNLLKKYN